MSVFMMMFFAINSENFKLTKISMGDRSKPVLIFGNMGSEKHKNWHHFIGNPVLKPEAPYELWAGYGNLYAPAILKRDGKFWLWYGAQNTEGHDQIHLAFSDDSIHWQRYENNPVIPVGNANHVNDPTVVNVNGTLYMYYSCAPVTEMDRIHLATSSDGMHWELCGEVISPGSIGDWDSLKVGRPSVIYEDGKFKVWYDGTEADPEHPDHIRPGTGRHVGFAVSSDGFKFTKEPKPVYLNSGAVDVIHLGDNYVMLFESGIGTHWAMGKNETHFDYQGLLLPKSGEVYDRYGQVTPMFLMENGHWTAIYYGAAEGLAESGPANWNCNRIGVAFPQKNIEIHSLSGEKIPIICRALDRKTIQVEFPENYVPASFNLIIKDGDETLFNDVLGNMRGGDTYELNVP